MRKTLLLLLFFCPLLVGAAGKGCAPAPPVPQSPAGARWLRGDFHCHTTHSRDARRQFGDDVTTTVRLAEWAGLDFVALTDHNTVAQNSDPGFGSQKVVLLAGEEWGASSHAGCIGITGLVTPLDRSKPPSTFNAQVQAKIDAVRAQGGIVVVNHPVGRGDPWLFDVKRFHAVEVWNISWSNHMKLPLDAAMLRVHAAALGLAPGPALAGAVKETSGTANDQAVRFWEHYLDRGHKIAAVGGGDRHVLFEPGSPSTYVYAAGRTMKTILDGVRQGRTYVNRGRHGATIRFTADGDGDGVHESTIGDTVGKGRLVGYQATVVSKDGGLALVIKNGKVLLRRALAAGTDTFTFADVAGVDSWYRIDVYEPLRYTSPKGPAFAQLVRTPYGSVVAQALSLVGFARAAGLSLAPVATTMPTLALDDELNRIMQIAPRHPGFCMGLITSPIYAR